MQCPSRSKLQWDSQLPCQPFSKCFNTENAVTREVQGSCFSRLCCLCIDRENMSEQLPGSLGR